MWSLTLAPNGNRESDMKSMLLMKRWLFCFVALLTGAVVSAQEALWSGGELISPEIHPDNRVTIRVAAPDARKVEVTGDFLPVRQIETPYGKAGLRGWPH